jgi:single-strand DNA-binding protein
MGVNKVILVGNVGRDPEMKALPSGTHITTFSLATTDMRSKDEQGNPRTEWHNIVAWGKLAEICNSYVTKGRQLYVEGSIRTRSWEQDGQKKYFTEIHAREIEFIGSRQGDGQRGSGYDQGANRTSDPSGPPPSYSDEGNEPPF